MKVQQAIKTLKVLGALLALSSSGHALAQEAEAMGESSREYGHEVVVQFPDFSGEEIETGDGRIVQYRQSDPYDEYEAAEGSNAIFVDMKTGKSQLVVPKDSDLIVFYLNIVYSSSDPDVGIGYVARVGTKADFAKGRIDVIIGRFSDLSQTTVFQNVRFVDSPTHVEGSTISMILWPQDMQARFTTIDLTSFAVTKSEDIDLPKPVEIIRKPCLCDESGYGERLETYSPWKDVEEAE